MKKMYNQINKNFKIKILVLKIIKKKLLIIILMKIMKCIQEIINKIKKNQNIVRNIPQTIFQDLNIKYNQKELNLLTIIIETKIKINTQIIIFTSSKNSNNNNNNNKNNYNYKIKIISSLICNLFKLL